MKGVSFAVDKGECFGLLGLNGAGKTTCFGMLTGKILPGAGSVDIQGYRLDFEAIQLGFLQIMMMCIKIDLEDLSKNYPSIVLSFCSQTLSIYQGLKIMHSFYFPTAASSTTSPVTTTLAD